VWVLGPVVAVLVVCVGFALLNLLRVERDLRSAERLLQQAGEAVEEGRLGDARGALAQATGFLVEANERLHQSASLDAVGWLPVITDNLASVERSVGLALAMSAGGERLLRAAAPLEAADGTLEVPLRSGEIPLSAVVDAHVAAANLAVALPGAAEDTDDDLLVPSVAELEDRVLGEAIERRAQLVDLAHGLRLVADMSGADGPRRYLLAIANTAEMRGTGGMILSYGVLEGEGGEFELPAFGPIDELFLDRPVPDQLAPLVAGEGERWGSREPTRLWRNANVIPDFGVVGPRLVAMYEQATGLEADGVIQIDAAGLAAILEGIGPITVDQLGTIDAGNVEAVTLNEAYLRFPDDQSERREVLGDVAEAVFDRLVEGQYDSLRPLGTAIVRAVAERHILVYGSTRPVASAAAYFGANGRWPAPDGGDVLALTVQNTGEDKLDYYLDTALRVRGERLVGEVAELQVEVTVTNTAPAGVRTPAYIFGGPGPPGAYLGVASLYAPVGSSVVDATGAAPSLFDEGGRSVVAWDLTVGAGESSTAVLTLRVPPRPPGTYTLSLLPAPRVRPTTVDVDLDVGDTRLARAGALVVPELLRAGT
jgi:hypothetical protein